MGHIPVAAAVPKCARAGALIFSRTQFRLTHKRPCCCEHPLDLNETRPEAVPFLLSLGACERVMLGRAQQSGQDIGDEANHASMFLRSTVKVSATTSGLSSHRAGASVWSRRQSFEKAMDGNRWWKSQLSSAPAPLVQPSKSSDQ